MRTRRLAFILFLALIAAGADTARAAQLVVAANLGASGATLRSFRASQPWTLRKPPLAIGADSVLARRRMRIYALSRRDGKLRVVARGKWTVRQSIDFGADSRPQDIVALSNNLAYVTTAASSKLLRVDPRNASVTEAVDLAVFADEDGNPDLGMMFVDGTRLLVQVRRANELAVGGFAGPALLAVIDLQTEQLIDVDPSAPGVQGIELEGTAPKHRMKLLPGSRNLMVSATGGFFDAGGIEQVNLDSLHSEGLLLREDDNRTGADLGPFAMLDADRGYLVFTTDFTLSSHLDRFTISSGEAENANLHVSVDYAVPELVIDLARAQLFVPNGAFEVHGVHVFDTATDQEITTSALETEGAPSDLLLVGAK